MARLNARRFAGDRASGLVREERGRDADILEANALHRLDPPAATEA
jgi:hypothetical protein